MHQPKFWDVFCKVVDNYGDIGVCWRLARQLASEHGLRVRLIVDDLSAFRRICNDIDATQAVQTCRGVEVRHWVEPFPDIEPAQVVVEAFACELPEPYVQAMAAQAVKPCWINLEYLSAEGWVDECHGMASPSPRLPLIKHFFFPGFAPKTGGVPMERDLPERRLAFQQDAGAQAAFWQELGLAPPSATESRISLFCYPDSRVEALFALWREQIAPVTCLVPEGIAGEAIAAFFGQAASAAGGLLKQGNLEVRILPFMEQDFYDRLLWACDCNFVRGEDSFVRAQWALKPLVWQPYPQTQEAHLSKLEAFLRIYCRELPAETAEAVSAFWKAWSRGEALGVAWPVFWKQRAILARHAEAWATALREKGDMATRLAEFCPDTL
ncbi:MAG: elongation factor P maturation arginine rhamnosyltransferase EarP [Betaproteobacteria bacterium]|nr:elongation factor P maturation arginine rhamnosyltransferase EarP [Betaproteobacteria bacterium]